MRPMPSPGKRTKTKSRDFVFALDWSRSWHLSSDKLAHPSSRSANLSLKRDLYLGVMIRIKKETVDMVDKNIVSITARLTILWNKITLCTYHCLKISYGQFFAPSKQNVFDFFGLHKNIIKPSFAMTNNSKAWSKSPPNFNSFTLARRGQKNWR